MLLVIWIAILGVSLFGLTKASDFFIDSSEKVGLSLHIPSFIIGVTIVSIGTSLPELLTSLFAVKAGSTEIVIGDVVGSNITNIFLGLGALPLIGGFFKINKNLVNVDLPFLIGSTFFITFTCLDGLFSRIESIFALTGFIIYIVYAKSEHTEFKNKLSEEDKINTPKIRINTIITLFGSCVVLYFCAEYTVKAIIKVSEIINIGTEIITASIVALGTSLPEIIASTAAIKKGKTDIAVGTLLGSNIFNAFGIMGISGIFSSLVIPPDMLKSGIYTLIIATLLYFFITHDREITRYEGALLILFYGLFLGKLYNIF